MCYGDNGRKYPNFPGFTTVAAKALTWCSHVPSTRNLRRPPHDHSALLPWWRHQMETFSALLAFCAGNSPVTGEFPAQRPVTRSFGVFVDLGLNERLSKQSWGWWFETPSRPLWRHSNGTTMGQNTAWCMTSTQFSLPTMLPPSL